LVACGRPGRLDDPCEVICQADGARQPDNGRNGMPVFSSPSNPSMLPPLLFLPGFPSPLRVLALMVVGCGAAWGSGGPTGGGACVARRHNAADAHHLRQRRSAPPTRNISPHLQGTRISLCRAPATSCSAPLALADRGPPRKPPQGSNSFIFLERLEEVLGVGKFYAGILPPATRSLPDHDMPPVVNFTKTKPSGLSPAGGDSSTPPRSAFFGWLVAVWERSTKGFVVAEPPSFG
jgi:hypothetical protein